jgi:hypothetical protein
LGILPLRAHPHLIRYIATNWRRELHSDFAAQAFII